MMALTDNPGKANQFMLFLIKELKGTKEPVNFSSSQGEHFE